MNLSNLLLAIFLILSAISTFGWAVIASWVIGLFAFAAGLAIVLSGLGVYDQPVLRRRQ